MTVILQANEKHAGVQVPMWGGGIEIPVELLNLVICTAVVSHLTLSNSSSQRP